MPFEKAQGVVAERQAEHQRKKLPAESDHLPADLTDIPDQHQAEQDDEPEYQTGDQPADQVGRQRRFLGHAAFFFFFPPNRANPATAAAIIASPKAAWRTVLGSMPGITTLPSP